MDPQDIPMLTSNTVEMGSGSNEWTPTSGKPMTLNVAEGQPLGEKTVDGVTPIISVPNKDEYPDGGLAT